MNKEILKTDIFSYIFSLLLKYKNHDKLYILKTIATLSLVSKQFNLAANNISLLKGAIKRLVKQNEIILAPGKEALIFTGIEESATALKNFIKVLSLYTPYKIYNAYSLPLLEDNTFLEASTHYPTNPIISFLYTLTQTRHFLHFKENKRVDLKTKHPLIQKMETEFLTVFLNVEFLIKYFTTSAAIEYEVVKSFLKTKQIDLAVDAETYNKDINSYALWLLSFAVQYTSTLKIVQLNDNKIDRILDLRQIRALSKAEYPEMVLRNTNPEITDTSLCPTAIKLLASPHDNIRDFFNNTVKKNKKGETLWTKLPTIQSHCLKLKRFHVQGLLKLAKINPKMFDAMSLSEYKVLKEGHVKCLLHENLTTWNPKELKKFIKLGENEIVNFFPFELIAHLPFILQSCQTTEEVIQFSTAIKPIETILKFLPGANSVLAQLQTIDIITTFINTYLTKNEPKVEAQTNAHYIIMESLDVPWIKKWGEKYSEMINSVKKTGAIIPYLEGLFSIQQLNDLGVSENKKNPLITKQLYNLFALLCLLPEPLSLWILKTTHNYPDKVIELLQTNQLIQSIIAFSFCDELLKYIDNVELLFKLNEIKTDQNRTLLTFMLTSQYKESLKHLQYHFPTYDSLIQAHEQGIINIITRRSSLLMRLNKNALNNFFFHKVNDHSSTLTILAQSKNKTLLLWIRDLLWIGTEPKEINDLADQGILSILSECPHLPELTMTKQLRVPHTTFPQQGNSAIQLPKTLSKTNILSRKELIALIIQRKSQIDISEEKKKELIKIIKNRLSIQKIISLHEKKLESQNHVSLLQFICNDSFKHAIAIAILTFIQMSDDEFSNILNQEAFFIAISQSNPMHPLFTSFDLSQWKKLFDTVIDNEEFSNLFTFLTSIKNSVYWEFIISKYSSDLDKICSNTSNIINDVINHPSRETSNQKRKLETENETIKRQKSDETTNAEQIIHFLQSHLAILQNNEDKKQFLTNIQHWSSTNLSLLSRPIDMDIDEEGQFEQISTMNM